MKTHFIPQNDKISFCDNIFYWLWHNTPKRGFPDRTFAIIAVLQFSYIVFFVIMLLILLNIVIERSIVDSFELLSSPLFILFVFLILINMKIYNENKYKKLQTHFNKLSLKEVKIYKKKFFYSMLISVIIIVIELLFFLLSSNPQLSP